MVNANDLIKELSKINEEFIKQYVYLKSNNGKHFKDWDEVLAKLANKEDVAKKDIIKGIDFAIGITDDEKTYNKYLPATKENVEKLKKKPIIKVSEKNESFYINDVKSISDLLEAVNESMEDKQDAIAKKIADAINAKFGWVLTSQGPYETYYIGRDLQPIAVLIKNDKDLQVQLRDNQRPQKFNKISDAIDFIKSNPYAYGFPGGSAFYGKLQAKADKVKERQKAKEVYTHDISDSFGVNKPFDKQFNSISEGTKSSDSVLSKIAKDILNIDSLETRNSDDVDFKEVSVWGLKKALKLAYRAGKKDKLSESVIDNNFEKGDDVKVFGRLGKVVNIRGDVLDIEFPADNQNMARSDSYYKQDVQKL